MRNVLLIAALFLSLSSFADEGSVAAEARSCEACPSDAPCGHIIPAGDGCNTCSTEVWCADGQWYQGNVRMCTLLSCGFPNYKIPNPFTESQK